jgi:hypothetical protein
MKTLKGFVRIYLFTVVFFSCLISNAQVSLKLTWGLENTEYFQETKSTKGESPAYHSKAKNHDKYYREFIHDSKYNNDNYEFLKRRYKLWEAFEESTASNKERTKINFLKYVENRDPYFVGMVKRLAPQLYFDFVGISKQYVLESITIATVNFEEFKGGGFSTNEAWYDIELKHKIGEYTYLVDKKFRFSGSGHAVLRFWSDNYYPSFGMTPSGKYTINVKFNFDVDGRKVSVSTGIFKISV